MVETSMQKMKLENVKTCFILFCKYMLTLFLILILSTPKKTSISHGEDIHAKDKSIRNGL